MQLEQHRGHIWRRRDMAAREEREKADKERRARGLTHRVTAATVPGTSVAADVVSGGSEGSPSGQPSTPMEKEAGQAITVLGVQILETMISGMPQAERPVTRADV